MNAKVLRHTGEQCQVPAPVTKRVLSASWRLGSETYRFETTLVLSIALIAFVGVLDE